MVFPRGRVENLPCSVVLAGYGLPPRQVLSRPCVFSLLCVVRSAHTSSAALASRTVYKPAESRCILTTLRALPVNACQGTAQKQLPRLTAGPTARAAGGTPSPLGLGLNEQTEMPKLFLSRSQSYSDGTSSHAMAVRGGSVKSRRKLRGRVNDSPSPSLWITATRTRSPKLTACEPELEVN